METSSAGSEVVHIVKVRGDTAETAVDVVVEEDPMEIRLGDVPVAVVMRTPGHDRELVRGFAVTEGIVLRPDEIADVVPLAGDGSGSRWAIRLAEGVDLDPEQFRRNLYTTSSCGVCGKASIDAVRVAAPQPPPGPRLTGALVGSLPAMMRSVQPTFELTGGLHAAALFGPDGTLYESREDVGRHNAVDKVVGAVAERRWPIGESILLVSGRVSFEMVQKAAVAGIPVVAGVSAASSLAVELAGELGMTVIGFLRDGGCNVYAGYERFA